MFVLDEAVVVADEGEEAIDVEVARKTVRVIVVVDVLVDVVERVEEAARAREGRRRRVVRVGRSIVGEVAVTMR